MNLATTSVDTGRLAMVLASATVAVALLFAVAGDVDGSGAADMATLILWGFVHVAALVVAGAPYWHARRTKHTRWGTDGAALASVGLVVVVGWLLLVWRSDGLLGVANAGEEPWPLALAPYILLGVVWRGRALLPALLALLVCGALDEVINGEMCLPAEERCAGPAGDAYIGALLATPMVLLGAAVSHAVRFGGARLRALAANDPPG